jgi:hypothetical protein
MKLYAITTLYYAIVAIFTNREKAIQFLTEQNYDMLQLEEYEADKIPNEEWWRKI